MTNQITITLSQTRRNAILGKVLTLLMIGFVSGYCLTAEKETQDEDGLLLTLEEYVAEFKAYNSELIDEPMSRWENMLTFSLCIFVFFGLYELVARLVGAILGMVLKSL
tara:strand:- start:109 stop:435 length:327 start_codon:yes stop_codon:yes gene_type:complete